MTPNVIQNDKGHFCDRINKMDRINRSEKILFIL